MNKVKYLLSVLTIILVSQELLAQRRAKVEDNEDTYKSMTSFGITTNTNARIIGGGVIRNSSIMSSKLFGKTQYRYLALELVNVKSPKEYVEQGYGTRIIFNKRNYLFAIRPEYGREISLFSRQNDEGLSMSAILAAGPTLGIEKPYMWQVKTRDGSVQNRSLDDIAKDPSLVQIAPAGFFSGFGQSKIIPGLHVKAALNFEINAFRESVTGVEIGFLAEGFTRKAEIMNGDSNRSFFTSGFLTLYFGNKKR